MKREDLLGVLSTVEPAIASNDLIPVLTHFWFTGTAVMAYNDTIAISAPYETEFTGAIRGSLLTGILSKLSGEDVDFTLDGNTVIIKSKRSKMTAPLLSTDAFLFEFPKVKVENATLRLKKDQVAELVAALEICLQSLSRRVSEPQRLGVTVVPDKNGLNFYATDTVTMSAASIKVKPNDMAGHVTLAKPFCESALKLLSRKGVNDVSLMITDEYVLLLIGDKDHRIKLYGRLVEDPNPPKFKDVIKRYLPEGSDDKLIGIPKGLADALDRAHLVIHKALEPVTTIKVVEGSNGTMLRILAKSEQGEVSESVKLKEGDDHEEVALEIDLIRFRECDVSKFDRILFDERCVVLARGSDMLHLIASIVS